MVDLMCDGRWWHVWEGVPGTGWYARLMGSSPPIVLQRPTEAGVLVAVGNWQRRLLLAPPAADQGRRPVANPYQRRG